MKLSKKFKEIVKSDFMKSILTSEMKMSRATYFRRLSKPEKFTLEEIKILERVTGLSQEQIFEETENK